MAEDPKFLLHFKTLAKFNEKLADGTINPNRHLVFISGNDTKPELLIWCRGRFYSDGSKFEDLVKYYNDYEITQTGDSSLTITLKGRLWNADTRTWSAITKPLTINSASASIAGLMSALDKRQLDIVSTANFLLSDPTYSTTAVTINATHTDVNSETTGLKTSKSLTAASSTKAGVMTSANYTEIYTNIPNSISNVNSTLSTSIANEVTRAKAAEKANADAIAAEITNRNTAISNAVNALDSTQTGSSTNVTVKVDLTNGKLTGVTVSLSDIASAATLSSHISNKSNPHSVTAAQVGLGNVNNTSDANKPISTATLTALNNKVDKVSGKGLSTNDFTTDEKNKLAGIASGANNYSLPLAANGTRGGVQIGYTANGKNYPVLLSSEKMYVNVPWTDTTYSNATTTTAGLMSSTNKNSINNLEVLATFSLIRNDKPFTNTASDVTLNYRYRNTAWSSNDPHGEVSASIGAASSTLAGVMTAADKIKLDNLSSTTADDTHIVWTGQAGPALSGTSTINTHDLRLYDAHLDLGSTGYPQGYGQLLRFLSRKACGELFFSYTSSSATNIYYRSKSDNDATPWSSWKKIAFEDEIADYVDETINLYIPASDEYPIYQKIKSIYVNPFDENNTAYELGSFPKNKKSFIGIINLSLNNRNYNILFTDNDVKGSQDTYFWVPWKYNDTNWWFHIKLHWGIGQYLDDLRMTYSYSCISDSELDNPNTEISVTVFGTPYIE